MKKDKIDLSKEFEKINELLKAQDNGSVELGLTLLESHYSKKNEITIKILLNVNWDNILQKGLVKHSLLKKLEASEYSISEVISFKNLYEKGTKEQKKLLVEQVENKLTKEVLVHYLGIEDFKLKLVET